MTRLRLDRADEHMHPIEQDKSFNESMYFNVFETGGRLGGFFRVGNRPNEGHAEVTCCLYLPDGRVAFMFQRPELHTNTAFDSAGMRFEVLEPFERLRVHYEGSVLLLDEPLDMADPRAAFNNNPLVDARVDLDYRGVSPMYGGEPEEAQGEGPIETDSAHPFARGHYEQHVGAQGTIAVGEQTWTIDGYGLRDHSWGPRYWQSPWWYRWLNACFDPSFGLMVAVIAGRDGSKRIGGVIFDEGEHDPIVEAAVRNTWRQRDGSSYPEALRATVRTGSGRELEIEGQPRSMIPLRNRRKDVRGEPQITRIAEAMTRYKIGDRTGYGIAEYLDQVLADGRPSGMADEDGEDAAR